MRAPVALYLATLGLAGLAGPVPAPAPSRSAPNPPGPLPGKSPNGPKRRARVEDLSDTLLLDAEDAARARRALEKRARRDESREAKGLRPRYR